VAAFEFLKKQNEETAYHWR